MLHQVLGVAFWGKAGHQDAAPALGEHGVDADPQAKAVEHRHGGQHFVAGTEHGVGGDDLLAEGIEVFVGEDDALVGAGGAARIKDDGGVFRGTLYLVVVEAAAAQAHEFAPADDRSIGGDLFDLAPLGKHITRLDGGGKGILDAGNDDVDHFGAFAHPFKLVVELVQGDGGNAARFVEI